MSKKIIVVSHKKFNVPNLAMYIPLHVGSKGKESLENYQRDDVGENISELNPYFCELTGLYWAWKNLDCEYIGLDHYRRYFSEPTKKFKEGMDINELVLKENTLENYLKNIEILVPKKRRYYIETLYSHYSNTFDSKHLDLTREIIYKNCPEYLGAFDKVMKRRYGYMFNMYIMKKSLSDEYCEWLFDILFELRKKIDISGYTAFEARLFGRVSELLFNVWLENINYEFKEIEYAHTFKVNWLKKGSAFLKAKILKKKYKESF